MTCQVNGEGAAASCLNCLRVSAEIVINLLTQYILLYLCHSHFFSPQEPRQSVLIPHFIEFDQYTHVELYTK